MESTSYFTIIAPGDITFCCIDKCTCSWWCVRCDVMKRWPTKHKIRDIFKELKAKGATYEFTGPKFVCLKVPQTLIHLHASLVSHNVPIELIKIVENYYGKDGPAEGIIYPLISKLIYNILSLYDLRTTRYFHSLPPENITSREFSASLYWQFCFGIGRIISDDDTASLSDFNDGNITKFKKFDLNPALFYRIYTEVNQLSGIFTPPRRLYPAPPSLAPPCFYNFDVEDDHF